MSLFKNINLSWRPKVFIGLLLTMGGGIILFTNATTNTSPELAHIQKIIPRFSERLQTECHCQISLDLESQMTKFNVGLAQRSISQTVKTLSRLCHVSDQKVCASIQSIHFNISDSANSLLSARSMGNRGLDLNNGTLAVQIFCRSP